MDGNAFTNFTRNKNGNCTRCDDQIVISKDESKDENVLFSRPNEARDSCISD